jgi:hypothetical protein
MIMKQLFVENGFQILYDKDRPVPIADGFYFTVTFPGLNQDELSRRFLKCGLGTISLSSMGSKKPGARIGSSMVENNLFNKLNDRLLTFNSL